MRDKNTVSTVSFVRHVSCLLRFITYCFDCVYLLRCRTVCNHCNTTNKKLCCHREAARCFVSVSS